MKHITAADVADIQNLVAQYCVTTDNADADGFMPIWVEPADFGVYDSGAFGTMDTWAAMPASSRRWRRSSSLPDARLTDLRLMVI